MALHNPVWRLAFCSVKIATLTVVLHAQWLAAVTQIKMGVILVSDILVPYSVQRVYPAIQIAMETVNDKYLNTSYDLVSELKVFDSVCDDRNSAAVAAKLFYESRISVFVGPACASALEDVGHMAGFWNIPVITGLGDGGQFKNKTDFPTLTRFSYCQCRLRTVFDSIFRQFAWRDIALIYDEDDEPSNVLGTSLSDGLRKADYLPYVIKYYESRPDEIMTILNDASQRARDTLRAFMLAAFDLGFPQSGDYVFMDVELFPFPGPYWGDHGWRRGDERDVAAREAYDAILRISLYLSVGEEWQHFADRVQDMAHSQFNFTFGSERVNFFVGAFHDAVLFYGMALNETLSKGSNILDGFATARRMWNKTVIGVTGDVIIDENGDRKTDFVILDMNMDSGEFEVIAYFWGAAPGFTPVSDKQIHWPGPRGVAPPNRPVCGFTGNDPTCQTKEVVSHYMAAVLSVLAVFIVLLVAAFFVYRRLVLERDLRSMAWKVEFQDILFRPLRSDSSKVCSRSEVASTGTSMDTDRQCFTNVAMYQGTRVAVKQIDIERLDITRSLLLEIKTVRDLQHENLTRLIGLCLVPKKVYILTEYCPKGSLQDVLLNDSIKLDWTFRLSLLSDITKVSSEEAEQYLRDLSWSKMVELLPSIVFMACLIVVGVPGNTLVFLVFWRYYKASSTRVFVLSMAVLDFITCVLSSSTYILQMRFVYSYDNPDTCGVILVAQRLPVASSAWLLAAVALDRRHRICRPFSRQLSPRQAWYLVIVSLVIGAAVTLPFIPLRREIAVRTGHDYVFGKRCGITDRYTGPAHRTVERFVLMLNIITGFLTLALCYVQIGCQVYKRRNGKRTKSCSVNEDRRKEAKPQKISTAPFRMTDSETDETNRKPEVGADRIVSGSEREADEDELTSRVKKGLAATQDHLLHVVSSGEEMCAMSRSVEQTVMSASVKRTVTSASVEQTVTSASVERTVSSTGLDAKDDTNPPGATVTGKKLPTTSRQCRKDCRPRVGREIPSRTTFMMFVLTIMGVAAYLPFIALSCFSGDQKAYCFRMEGWRLNACMISLLFVNLNGVINPFIYSFCNPAFRHKCRRFFTSDRNCFPVW